MVLVVHCCGEDYVSAQSSVELVVIACCASASLRHARVLLTAIYSRSECIAHPFLYKTKKYPKKQWLLH